MPIGERRNTPSMALAVRRVRRPGRLAALLAVSCTSPIPTGELKAAATGISPPTTVAPIAPRAPLCADVAASQKPNADGSVPLPPAKPPFDISPPALTQMLAGLAALSAGYNPWLQHYAVQVGAKDVEAAQFTLGRVPNPICIDTPRTRPTAEFQATSGAGWRLIAAGSDAAKTTIGVALNVSGHSQLRTDFSIPLDQKLLAQDSEILVAYSIHPSGECSADRVIGIRINGAMRTFEPVMAAPPATDQCPLARRPWTLVLAVDRSLFPSGPVAFRRCENEYRCNWDFALTEVLNQVPYIRAGQPGGLPTPTGGPIAPSIPPPRGTFGSCGGFKLPPGLLLCDLVRRYDATRFLATVRYRNGRIVFYLVSETRAPIGLPGYVITSGRSAVAMLVGNQLIVRRKAATAKVLRFTHGLPRANSSGSEGAFNASGSRVAVMLQAPGTSRDSGSVAIGLIDVGNGTMRVVPTIEWRDPTWTSDSTLRVGAISINAKTGKVTDLPDTTD